MVNRSISHFEGLWSWEALRGFDAPMVFSLDGSKASLAEIADQEVPGRRFKGHWAMGSKERTLGSAVDLVGK